MLKQFCLFVNLLVLIAFTTKAQPPVFFTKQLKTDSSKVLRAPILSPNYYTESFGLMCKKELQLEKATKIPFRFRLGSLDYCNQLEGKH
jgi:hypothetical protein